MTIVCPEFPATQAAEWIKAGQIPELARTAHRDYVDLDSGHWPTFTRPAELAGPIAAAADATRDRR